MVQFDPSRSLYDGLDRLLWLTIKQNMQNKSDAVKKTHHEQYSMQLQALSRGSLNKILLHSQLCKQSLTKTIMKVFRDLYKANVLL